MTELIKQHLNHANVRMKHQDDKGRTDSQFEAGDEDMQCFLSCSPIFSHH
jgi:hypothetical protein